MTNTSQTPKEQLLDAALIHVAFDGWSEATFKAAVRDTGMDPTVARAVCPRGAVDLAVAYHNWFGVPPTPYGTHWATRPKT